MKTCIFLTTRYASTRLPQKHLLKTTRETSRDFTLTETLTDTLINRLKKTCIPIIMVTPDTPEDIEYMEPIASRNHIGYYAGEIENIIKRHKDCAKEHNVDWVIEADGDDILLCPETIIEIYEHILIHCGIDIITTTGLPVGLNCFAYKTSILNYINYKYDTDWGRVIKNAGKIMLTINNKSFPDFRITLDYKEDFEVIRDIIESCKNNETVSGICDYLNKNPEIVDINKKCIELYEKNLKKHGKEDICQ